MKNYIDAAVSRSRTTLSVFVAIMLTGFVSYLSIPVELNPDVTVPIIVSTIIHEGISPEDAERLLARPAELELKTLDGISQISSVSSEGAATVITEFDIDFESSNALIEVREAINRAKVRFPQSTEEPIIQEVSAAEMPIVQIAIGGEGVPERVLLRIAENLQREIEILPQVLEALMVAIVRSYLKLLSTLPSWKPMVYQLVKLPKL
jgi:multidrug efflux pump